MKTIIWAILTVALLIIAICLLLAGRAHKRVEQPPSETNAPAYVHPRRARTKAPTLQVIPEPPGDAVAVQAYLEAKEQLLLDQLGFVADASLSGEDFPKFETGRQVDEELARWAAENEMKRERQRQATVRLLQNEQDVRQAIGDRTFAELQAWEAAYKPEEPK